MPDPKPAVYPKGSPEYELAKKKVGEWKSRKVRSNYGGKIPPTVCYE